MTDKPTLPQNTDVPDDVTEDTMGDFADDTTEQDLTNETEQPEETGNEKVTPNFTLAGDLYVSHKPGGEPVPIELRMTVVPSSGKAMAEILNNSAFVRDMVQDISIDESVAEWINALQLAPDGLTHRNLGVNPGQDRTRHWVNNPSYKGSEIGIRRNSYKLNRYNANVAGKAAVNLMSSLTGGPVPTWYPLWNTGIWIAMSPLTNGENYDISQELAQERADLSRETKGSGVTADTAYITNVLTKYLRRKIVNHNVADLPDDVDIIDVILNTDFDDLVWTQLRSKYPTGYDYQRPCTADPKKCHHVEQGRINIARMRFVDENSLTQDQLKHMCNANTKITMADVENYQSQFESKTTNYLDIKSDKNDNIRFFFAAPAIPVFLDASLRWKQMIKSSLEDVFKEAPSENERLTYLHNRSDLAGVRKYSHYINRIEITPADTADDVPPITIMDPDTIEDICESTLASTPELTAKVINAILTYIDGSKVTIIGTPNYKCSSCGQSQIPGVEDETVVIPQDIVNDFFTLTRQSVIRTPAE